MLGGDPANEMPPGVSNEDMDMDTPGGTAVLRAVPSQHSRLGINRLLRCVAVLNKSRSHAQCNIVYSGPIAQLVIY